MMNNENLNRIIELRHDLHRHPELSLREEGTIRILQEFLRRHTSLEIVDQDGWFYAFKKGASGAGAVAFRADMDALPIGEGPELPYASENAGAAHKCGHDGHMAALCGLALELEGTELQRDLYLIFQPAEEIGLGARRCAQLIREKDRQEIYAFHNLGGYPENSIVYRRGLTQPSSEGIIVRFHGEQSHASYPEDGKNPAQALAELVSFAMNLPSDYPDETFWCTVVGVKCGEADFGISPGEGSVAFTLRAGREMLLRETEKRLIRCSQSVALEYGLQTDCEIRDYFPETRNDDKALDRVLDIAQKKGLDVIEMQEMWRASEDFGYYTKECPGAIFYVGTGEDYPHLHTREYEFNDNILPAAVDVFKGLCS